jgi:hypothetical protein
MTETTAANRPPNKRTEFPCYLYILFIITRSKKADTYEELEVK